MSIEIRFYGSLKKHISSRESSKGFPNIIEKGIDDLEDVSCVLEDLGIPKDEISHVFVNGDYSGISREIEDGDRVALFPKDMSLIYKWYFPKSKGKKS